MQEQSTPRSSTAATDEYVISRGEESYEYVRLGSVRTVSRHHQDFFVALTAPSAVGPALGFIEGEKISSPIVKSTVLVRFTRHLPHKTHKQNSLTEERDYRRL